MYGRRMHPLEALFEWFFEGGCVFLVVVVPLVLLFLSTMARAAGRVSRENRRIEPSQVWLNLIPVFNLVWLPITVDRIAASIRSEYEDRGLDEPGEAYTRTSGLTWLTLWILCIPALVVAERGPSCVVLLLPVCLIFWATYWSQLAGYARRLKATKDVPPADEGW